MNSLTKIATHIDLTGPYLVLIKSDRTATINREKIIQSQAFILNAAFHRLRTTVQVKNNSFKTQIY